MLHKCANPVCCAQFRYLHQGKLFELEIQYVESTLGDAQGKLGNGKGHSDSAIESKGRGRNSTGSDPTVRARLDNFA